MNLEIFSSVKNRKIDEYLLKIHQDWRTTNRDFLNFLKGSEKFELHSGQKSVKNSSVKKNGEN